jgi:hypothetical protein
MEIVKLSEEITALKKAERNSKKSIKEAQT